jgi:hypothetical protein
MRIEQVSDGSLIFSENCWNKWFCSNSAMGSDNQAVHRYLQEDGTWGRCTHYFDSRQDVEQALAKGYQPDFTLSEEQLHWRQVVRQDIEDAWRDLNDLDDYYDNWYDSRELD